MNRQMSDEQLDRVLARFLAERRTEIEMTATPSAEIVARLRPVSRWAIEGTGTRVAWLLLILALALALVVGAIVVGASRRDPVTPILGRNGAIAYTVRDIAGPPYDHVHLINADGTEDREIAQGSCPTYSGDGHVLAYTSGWHKETPITVAGSDGSSPRTVPYVGDWGLRAVAGWDEGRVVQATWRRHQQDIRRRQQRWGRVHRRTVGVAGRWGSQCPHRDAFGRREERVVPVPRLVARRPPYRLRGHGHGLQRG